MIHISIQYKQYRSYSQASNCIITGEAFYQNHLYKDDDLLQLISSCETEEQFIDRLKQLNGFYALIKHTDQQLFAAVDRVRSIPLFYGQKGADFFLSDSAEWVRQQVGNTEMDPLAREEFLLTGYVTGPDTLFPDVKQLQAGEALIVSDNNTEPSISMERYYRFIHQNTLEASEEELLSKLDEVLLNVFKRLIKLADGRTLVVPLSGGYDSRLIVLMLKRLGYDNVITFTYGRPGNKESEISKQVANALGYRWEFIPYSNETWYNWFHSEECKKYWLMAGGLCTLPHNQDWPAVWEMKKQKIIPDNAIFIPGHTGDFIAGGHIPLAFDTHKNLGEKKLINAIQEKHYCLYDLNKCNGKNLFDKRIINRIELNSYNNAEECANAFEKWEWQERQAKFIINSLRVYEFWDYNWWMPFWDAEFMDYWCRVPLKYRFQKKLYDQYVKQLYSQIVGGNKIHIANPKPFASKISHALFKILKATPFYPPISKLYNYYNKKTLTEYDKHPLAAWGRYAKTREEFYQTYSGKKSPLSVNTIIYVELVTDITDNKRDCY